MVELPEVDTRNNTEILEDFMGQSVAKLEREHGVDLSDLASKHLGDPELAAEAFEDRVGR